MMFTALFWKDASERAVKTFAQTLVALFTVGVTVLSIDWTNALSVSATAALVSLLSSVVSGRATKNKPTVSPASAATDKRGV